MLKPVGDRQKHTRAREKAQIALQGQWTSPRTPPPITKKKKKKKAGAGPFARPEASHNHSHSGLLECIPWKFRQVSYLWKISCSLVSRHCCNQTTTPYTPHPKSDSPFPPFPPSSLCVELSNCQGIKWNDGTYKFSLTKLLTICCPSLSPGLEDRAA